jgi:hypothetical protein
MFTVRAASSVRAYGRIVNKRTGFPCIIIYTGVKVVVAAFDAYGLENLVSILRLHSRVGPLTFDII